MTTTTDTNAAIRLLFHSDPAHGWLQVPRDLIDALGIAHRISQFSYVDATGAFVYLEEDCDASLFVAMARDAGWTLDVKEVDHRGECFIRNCNRYRRPA